LLPQVYSKKQTKSLLSWYVKYNTDYLYHYYFKLMVIFQVKSGGEEPERELADLGSQA